MTAIALTAANIARNSDTKTRSYIAAETITAGQAVYKLAAGTVGVADANASGKKQYRGIAINGGAAGTPIMVAYFGSVDGFTLTGDVDTLVYLSDTAGGLDTAAGSTTVPVGRVDMRDDGTKFLFTDVNWLADWA
jgi:hypothetical protein